MGTGTSYYIRQGKDVQGPFARTRILEWIADGRVRPEMMLSEDGKTWFEGSSLPELFEAAESTALTPLYHRAASIAEGPVELRVLRRRHAAGSLPGPLLVSSTGDRWYEWEQLDRALVEAGAPLGGPGAEQQAGAPRPWLESRLPRLAVLLLILCAAILNQWYVASAEYERSDKVRTHRMSLGYFDLHLRNQRGDDDPKWSSAPYVQLESHAKREDSEISESDLTTTRVFGVLLFAALGLALLAWVLTIVLQMLPPWAGQTFLGRAPRAAQVTLMLALVLGVLFSFAGVASELGGIIEQDYAKRDNYDKFTGWGLSLYLLVAACAVEITRVVLARRNH